MSGAAMPRPIGYFVHHQGRGHAERAAAIANALAPRRPVVLFSARGDIFPALNDGVEVMEIPSLFEPAGGEPPALADLPTPETLHCAPVGWRTITRATATIAGWFDRAAPALFVTDVSAELAQLARICSIPHVCVLQHGDRGDPGHLAAYAGALGLLAPYAQALDQPDRAGWMRGRTHFAGGVGIACTDLPTRAAARAALALPDDRNIVLVLAGGGGTGTPTAPLTLGARAEPDALWITIGRTASEWHETPPANLRHQGWVDRPELWIAAADRVVSSCGNTTCHQVLAAARPWVAVPEWRYFAEQEAKARALAAAGVAAVRPSWPADAGAWAAAWAQAATIDPARQRALVDPRAVTHAAAWLDRLAAEAWAGADTDTAPAAAQEQPA